MQLTPEQATLVQHGLPLPGFRRIMLTVESQEYFARQRGELVRYEELVHYLTRDLKEFFYAWFPREPTMRRVMHLGEEGRSWGKNLNHLPRMQWQDREDMWDKTYEQTRH